MNSSALNASALNGNGVIAGAVVSLGAVSVSMRFLMYEHESSEMSGTITMAMDASGNLARLVLLGDAVAGFVFSESATLSEDTTDPLGPGSAAMTFVATADIHRVARLGAVSASIAMAISGALNRRQPMSAVSGITFSASGALMQYIKQPLPTGSAGITMEANATLFKYSRLGGVQANITFDISGILATLAFISGSTNITFTVTGALFNNPAGPDLDSYTMVRPYINRTMVRQS